MSSVPLHLRLLEPLDGPLNVSPLTPERLHGLSVAGIRRILLDYRGVPTRLDTLYAVSGEDTRNIYFVDGSPFLQCLGQGMTNGRIQVDGDCGDFAGQSLRGGQLIVAGNTGHWAGHRMQGGYLRVLGNAGDFLAAARPGEPYGMYGGLISVAGSAGSRAGDRMRRGCLVILGSAGAYCASRMCAGTIIVLGRVAEALAYGMRRGSVILSRPPGRLLASFRVCGALELPFLSLLFRHLLTTGAEEMEVFSSQGACAQRLVGDGACGAKGEILILSHREDPAWA